MNKEEFLNLVWQMEEMLTRLNDLRGRIGKCKEKCEIPDAEHDEGLCPACSDVFAMVLAEEERLARDKEFNEIVDKLKKACEEDKSGMFLNILERSREAKVIH